MKISYLVAPINSLSLSRRRKNQFFLVLVGPCTGLPRIEFDVAKRNGGVLGRTGFLLFQNGQLMRGYHHTLGTQASKSTLCTCRVFGPNTLEEAGQMFTIPKRLVVSFINHMKNRESFASLISSSGELGELCAMTMARLSSREARLANVTRLVNTACYLSNIPAD